MNQAQSQVHEVVEWLVLGIEVVGAAIITIGVLIAITLLVRALRHPEAPSAFTRVRLVLGSYLVLALEFQLAADILKTAVTPSFSDIGQLAAIAAIRTLLNYFLTKEIAQEKAELAASNEVMKPLPTPRH
jgi:uncharacterized membrane protein